MVWDNALFKEFQKLKRFFTDALSGNLKKSRSIAEISTAIKLIKRAGGLAQWYLGTCLQPIEYFRFFFYVFFGFLFKLLKSKDNKKYQKNNTNQL